MARKPMPKPPPPPVTVDWTQYRPTDPRYWVYGGPWVVPEDIPPADWREDYIAFGKKPETRRKFALEIIARERDDLERRTARYVALWEKGMDALEEHIRARWAQTVHAGNSRNEPDPVSEHLSYCYRDIAHARGKIATCKALIVKLDRATMPLLAGLD